MIFKRNIHEAVVWEKDITAQNVAKQTFNNNFVLFIAESLISLVLIARLDLKLILIAMFET